MFRRMFKSTSNCFAAVRCPKADSCALPHCIFSHTATSAQAKALPSATTTAKRPLSTSAAEIVAKKFKESPPLPRDDTKPVPRALSGVGAPATHQQRMRYIAALTEAHIQNRVPMPTKKAVEKEFEVASSSSAYTYKSNMTSALKAAKNNVIHYMKPQKKKKSMTEIETYDAVKKLVHAVDKLKKNQYITEVPNIEGFTFETTKQCDRCAEHFPLKDILNKTGCRYHERRKRIENNNRYWECCSQVVGDSQGCKTNDHHVFKAKTAEEMHAIIPFQETPKAAIGSKKNIVGLDCEMGYTSKGMEMIRLTVMDFFTGKVLCDEVVKPSGTILDLNTNWSGVSEIAETALTLDEIMKKVLGDLINQDTIIVGHGLENDLNTMRLVHHQVVDTAVLFPKGLDRKYSLKELAFNFLDRKIQGGEHSSEEDSLAAIDIIKAHILSL